MNATKQTVELVNPGAFRVTEGRKSAEYLFRSIPCSIGGQAFQVEKVVEGEIVESYAVRIGRPRECSCECKGFVYRTYCRHILALRDLRSRGQLLTAEREEYLASFSLTEG